MVLVKGHIELLQMPGTNPFDEAEGLATLSRERHCCPGPLAIDDVKEPFVPFVRRDD